MTIQSLIYKIPALKKRRISNLRERGYLLTNLIRSSMKNGSQLMYIANDEDIQLNGKFGDLFLICSCFMGLISPEDAVSSRYDGSIKSFGKYPQLAELYWKIRDLDSIEIARYLHEDSDPESIAVLETIKNIDNSLPSNENLFYSMTNYIDRMCK